MRKMKKNSVLFLLLIGLSGSAVITAVLCLCISAAVYRGILPPEGTGLYAVIAAGAALFVEALLISRRRGKQPLLTGGMLAGGWIILCVLLSLCIGGGAVSGEWFFHLSLTSAAACLLGSVMSIAGRTGKRRRSMGKR